jgi:transcriptional regulator with XRE-family HTH domain
MNLSLNELAKLARELREENNLTQAQAASRLSGSREVAQSHVSRAERGQEKYASLAVRLVEEIGGLEVETIYRVQTPKNE